MMKIVMMMMMMMMMMIPLYDRNRETGEMFAIKTIRKAKVSRLDSLRREIEILQTVDHPQIIKVCMVSVLDVIYQCHRQ